MTPTMNPPTVAPPMPPTAVPLMTLEEFVRKHSADRVELVRGVVEELPTPTPKHGRICTRMARMLDEFAEKHDLGHVSGFDAFVRIPGDPPTVRGADVCFYSYSRVPKGEFPEGIPELGPELVVEVRSPTNTWIEMIGKAMEYFSAGVLVVVVLDPATRSASAYRPDARTDIFEAEEDLTLPDVLPGFSVAVRKFFE
jgi:Uma2 family endonuclease